MVPRFRAFALLWSVTKDSGDALTSPAQFLSPNAVSRILIARLIDVRAAGHVGLLFQAIPGRAESPSGRAFPDGAEE